MSRAGHACQPPCAERMEAMRAGEFVWLASLRAYVFPDGPKRRASPIAIVRSHYGKGENMTGWPYTFDTCPFCGGDLDTTDHGEGDE